MGAWNARGNGADTPRIYTRNIATAGQIGKLQLSYVATTDLFNPVAFAANVWNTTSFPLHTFAVDDPNSVVEIAVGGQVQVIAGGANIIVGVRLNIDAGARLAMRGGVPLLANGHGNMMSGVAPYRLTGLTVGSHTVRVEFIGTGAGNAYLAAASFPNSYAYNLSVMEQKR